MDEGRAGQARRWLGSACRAFQASCRPLCRRLWPSGLRPGCRAGLTRPALKGARGVASRRPATPAQLDTPPPDPRAASTGNPGREAYVMGRGPGEGEGRPHSCPPGPPHCLRLHEAVARCWSRRAHSSTLPARPAWAPGRGPTNRAACTQSVRGPQHLASSFT